LGLSQEIDVSGDWELTMETPRGKMTQKMHIEQEGEKVIVTMEGMGGEESTGEGTLQGSKITWSIIRSTPRGDFTITYAGAVEGDTRSGTAQRGDRGSMEWTAKRGSGSN
jgi:hypothetical protein